jgi:RNA ligase
MTLHYDFPCIAYWHTVAKHFEDNENFVIVDKDEYFVVNYVRMGKDTHPPIEYDGTDYARATILREARGLIFCSKTGELLSRPFHKFFNLGEREDAMEIDLSKPHVIMEKLDGSMIRPLRLSRGPNRDGHVIRWATKMGVTDVAMQAEEFVAKNPQYTAFADSALEVGFTPIFEWCSRQQRIVIDYPEDKLVLLAMRDNFTGEYMSRKSLMARGKLWNIPVVNVLDMTDPAPSQEELVEMIRGMSDMEGVVVQFVNGHMVKIKADQYVALHRAKSLLENERDVVGLVLDEKVDDLMPLLHAADRKRLDNFSTDVWADILLFQTRVNAVLQTTDGLERKAFALSSETMEPLARGAVFKHWDIRWCTIEYVVELVRKHLGSKAAYDKVKSILKTASWKENKTDE